MTERYHRALKYKKNCLHEKTIKTNGTEDLLGVGDKLYSSGFADKLDKIELMEENKRQTCYFIVTETASPKGVSSSGIVSIIKKRE